ncbi:MAG: PrsW family intramembrane metalloprotease [Micrococcales bacterium]|nr:PrsW family intramembrane metalloprotease [Micrococcales bacterium]
MTLPGSPNPSRRPDGPRTAGSTAAGPQTAPAELQAATRLSAHPGFVPLAPRRAGLVVAAVLGIALAALAALVAAAYLLLSLGAATFVAAILALIPLTIVLLGIRWVDRWEPEPLPARIFAGLWGAGVAVVVALAVGAQVDRVLAAGNVDPGSVGAQFFGSVVQAPIVEEGAKGLGVLLVFLVARRLFDGPVDGVVYAATVGAGFAFTENVLYFGRDIAEGGSAGSVALTFFLRGVLSPFAHVMFTSMTGLAIGIAASRGGRGAGVLAYFLGLIPASLLHALWNGSSYFTNGLAGYLGFYAIVQIPLFIGLVLIVVYLRRQEARQTATRLSEYAAAGWFNPAEVVSLATPAGRRQARAWASRHGRGPAMRAYIRDATRLAAARQRIVADRNRSGAQQDEARLLASITAERRALLGV